MKDTSKPGLAKTLIFLALAICAYLIVFMNIEQLNQYFLSKAFVPALCLLGTVISIAFLYGTAVSYLLGLLGLESSH